MCVGKLARVPHLFHHEECCSRLPNFFALTSASVPACLSMMLPRYVNDSTSPKKWFSSKLYWFCAGRVDFQNLRLSFVYPKTKLG